MTDLPAVQLIGLDWGTSSLRAYAYGDDGQVLQQRQSAQGMAQASARGEEGFFQALAELVGDWVAANPAAPLLACGMVGSAQGWREAAYRPLPAALDDLAHHATVVPLSPWSATGGAAWQGRALHILPGLLAPGDLARGVLPNVMRGEETQIAGALHGFSPSPGVQESLQNLNLRIGLPGTHSKWVRLQDGCVVHFDTFLIGEMFAALRQHTILGRTMAPVAGDVSDAEDLEQGFALGVRVAASAAGRLGVLGNVFSTRALGLTGDLPPEQQADYLSGLLIGHEVQALVRQWLSETDGEGEAALPGVWLIGERRLCQRYTWALRHSGVQDVRWLEQATQAGLWHLGQVLL